MPGTRKIFTVFGLCLLIVFEANVLILLALYAHDFWFALSLKTRQGIACVALSLIAAGTARLIVRLGWKLNKPTKNT